MFPMSDEAAQFGRAPEDPLHFPEVLETVAFAAVIQLSFFSIVPMRKNQLDLPGLQSFSRGVAAVGFVGDQFLMAPSFSRHSDLFQRGLNEFHLRRRGRGNCASKRNTLSVDHHYPFRTLGMLDFADQGLFFSTGRSCSQAGSFPGSGMATQ